MLDDFRDDEDMEKGGDFLDEFRQRLSSQPIDNFEERKNEINRSQHVFLGTVLGVGLAGIVSWFILSPDYNNTQDSEIPVIRRPQTAIKVQPADPGGMEILNQDKTVYDIVEKKDNPEIKVENLLPPPEQPKMPTITAEAETVSGEITQAATATVSEAEKIIAENSKPAQEAVKTEAKAPVKEEVKIEEKVTVTVKEEPKEQPAPQKQVAAQTIPNGVWQIQLISSPNKSAMDKAWGNLNSKYAVLKGLPYEVEAADLGAKGTFYRLKAGAFKERADADKVCNSIKTAGGSCLVKKK